MQHRVLDASVPEERSAWLALWERWPGREVFAHPDYVRSVRILPRGPERIELTVDWLLPPGVAERHADALEKMYELGRLVVAQDGRVCELNQRGLRSRRHRAGVLMPQEAALHEFHEWLKSRLAEVA